MFIFFTDPACFERLDCALKESGFANLVGGPGAGKTFTLRRFQGTLDKATCSFLDCSHFSGDPGRFIDEMKAIVRPWQGREGRLVIILDEWCAIAPDLRESEVCDFQQIAYVTSTRGPGSGVIFGSRMPLRGRGDQALPASILANLIEIELSAPSRDDSYDHWQKLFEQRMARIAPDVFSTATVDGTIDADVVHAYLQTAPEWAVIKPWLQQKQKAWPDGGRLAVLTIAMATSWARFLAHLCRKTPWLVDESRSRGYDPFSSSGPVAFTEFLARTHRSPEEFIADLLRTSDLQSVFPETRCDGTKADRVVTAARAFEQKATVGK